MRFVKATVLVAALAVAATVSASIRDVQVYGIVEKVEFEPNERAPQRIKISGVFTLLYTNQQPVSSAAGPYAPHRGYLYFKLPSAKPAQEAAKKEWADLKAVAGTGQAITFGSWTSAYLGTTRHSDRNGFVSASEDRESLLVNTKADGRVSPITYTMDSGIVKLGSTGSHALIVRQLEDALSRP